MRIPQAAERLKEAPAQALRAVFSGVGQMLLVTERVRRRAMGDDQKTAVAQGAPAAAEAGPGVAEAAARTVTAETAAPPAKPAGPEAGPGDGPQTAAKPADRKTTPDKPRASKASSSTAKSGTAKASTGKASTAKAAPAKAAPAKAAPAKAAKAASAGAAATEPAGTPPIPHYSDLTVASLRARMRGLDAAQLRGLISYERAHEDRETVIAMFERRIAKLEADGPAAAG
jgi:outer membrane biosynthesis protein TonB